ncbi:hypothetical protein [Enterococcus caccae]|uniref:Uncharacterized protein n=1 Tax=Enterococcus caccae ATCC BAA-1240 TaxID=1158612 RepID=R3TXA7_9ENTE|nr:hypothetical protein [Enterococcus caccae]EOL45768.1 hypothetical protein UC7_01565 [Enterococcus caccae ATCC BAA-1240]EOT60964.1 hypothetical protein I580_01866 [Enterococcus caccae ATCC BAA-1240]OJG28001.1 hypothetical protein RU98_GL002210 [Enterococcus caccae]
MEETGLKRALYDLVYKILKDMLSEAIKLSVERFDLEKDMFDRKEIARRNSMSMSTAERDLFSDPRMIAIERKKKNGKCYYDAEKAKKVCKEIIDGWDG